MDADTWLAYYMFVNFGASPEEIARKGIRERVMMYEMARMECASRTE